MKRVFGNSTKILVPVVIMWIVLIAAFGVWAAQPTLSITQTLPAATYINDGDGQTYQMVLQNESIYQAHAVAVQWQVYDTVGHATNSHFSYVADSLQAILHDASAGTDSVIDASVLGTPDAGKLKGPFTVSFASPVDLDPDDTLTITYRLATDATLTGGDLNAAKIQVRTTDDEAAEYSFEDEEPVRVKAGEVTVELTPAALPFSAHRSETVTLDAKIVNEGDGIYFFNPNEKMMVSWEDGFAQPALVDMPGHAVPTLQDHAYALDLTELAPGESKTFRFTLLVEGFQEFGLTAVYDNTVTHQSVTDTEHFVFLINQPDVTVTVVKEAHLQYGADSAVFGDTMSLKIENHSTQFGTARQFKLRTDFDMSLVDISLPAPMQALWDFNPLTKIFTYKVNDGVIAELDSVDLDFFITPQFTPKPDKCDVHDATNSNTSKSYALMLIPEYTNDMNRLFITRYVRTQYHVEHIPTIDITRGIDCELSADGDNRRIFLNENVTFTFTVHTTNLDKWDADEEIVFTTNLPNVFILNSLSSTNAIQPTASAQANGSNDITWRMTPADALAGQTLTLHTKATNDPSKAGNFISNTAVVTGKSIVGCTLTDAISTGFYLQSREEETRFLYESKNITNLPAEGRYDVCGKDEKNQVDYELHYVLDPTSSGIWTDSTYTDKLDRSQTYLPGSAEFRTEGGWTAIPAGRVLSTSPLIIDLGFVKDEYAGDDTVKGKILDLRYTLILNDATQPSIDTYASEFVSQSDMVITNAVGGDVIAGKHHFYQGVFVPVSRARMGVDLSLSVNDMVAKAEPLQATISINKITPWNANTVCVVVDLDENFAYMGNPVYTGFHGVEPIVTEDDYDLDGHKEIRFMFPQSFDVSETGVIGTIRFDAVKTHVANTLMKATLVYTDDLLSSYDVADQEQPAYLLEGNLDLVVIPTVADLSTNTVKWTYDIVNMGSGTAYNTHVQAKIKDVLTFARSKVDGVPAVPTSTVGGGTDTLEWSLGDLLPGQSKRIEVTANTSGSGADFTLASTASADYGWYDLASHFTECQQIAGNSGNDFPAFRKPTSAGFITNDNVPAINLEESGILRLRVENTGETDNYNIEIRQILPNAFTYRSGTAQIGGTPVNDPQLIPNGSDVELVWNEANLPNLAVLHPHDTFVVEYEVDTTEAFLTNNIVTSSASWQKPWEVGGGSRTGSFDGINYAVPRNLPHITVVVDGLNQTTGQESYTDTVTASINDNIEWRIRITNSGQAAAYNMTLNHTLAANMSFTNISDKNMFTDLVNRGNWNIGDLAAGSTKTYYVTARFDGPCQAAVSDQARVSWGSQTGTLTAPGTPQDTASLVTQPVVTEIRQTIDHFTTKGGNVTITIQHTGAPLYHLTIEQNLTMRYELAGPCTYSSSIASGQLATLPVGQDGDAPLRWEWNGPIAAGTHTIQFPIREANGSAGNTAPLTAALSVDYQNSAGQLQELDRTDEFTPAAADLDVSFGSAYPAVQLKDDGETIRWEVVVANSGGADAENVKVVDVLGNGYTYVSSSSYAMTKVGDDYTWTIPLIKAHEQASFYVDATVHGAGSHVNTVTATERSSAGTLITEDSAQAYTTVFHITITANTNTGNPNDPTADTFGELVEYTVTAEFLGDDTYKNIAITDTLPNGLQFVDETLPGGVTPQHAGKNLKWNIADFSNAASYTIRYRARVIKEGSVANNTVLTNKANAAFAIDSALGALSFTKAGYPALEASNASVTVREPSVSVQSRSANPPAGSNVAAGQGITHTLTVKNARNAPAYLVKVKDTLPAGVRSYDPTPTVVVTKNGNPVDSADYTVNYNPATGELTWTMNSNILDGNAYYTIQYTPKVNADISAGTDLNFSSNVMSYSGQPAGTTGIVSYGATAAKAAVFHTTDSTAALTCLNHLDGKVTPGDTVTYQIEFSVPNGTSVYDLAVECNLPPGMAYAAGSSTGPGRGTGGSGPDLGNPAPGITGTVETGQKLLWFGGAADDITNTTGSAVTYRLQFEAVVNDIPAVVRGVALNHSVVYNFNAINGDNSTRTNHPAANKTLTVVEPALTVGKTVTSTGPYAAGDTITYRVSLNHAAESNAAAYDIVLTETLPDGVNYVSFTPVTGNPGAVNIHDQQLTWGSDGSIDLPAGQSLVLDVTGKLDTAVEPAQTLTSGSSLLWTGANLDLTGVEREYTAATSANTTVSDPTAISQDLHNPPATFVVGGTYGYRLVVNIIEGTTDNVVVKTTLPDGLIFAGDSIAKGAGMTGGALLAQPTAGSTGALTWNFGRVTNEDNGLNDDQIIIDFTVRIANDPVNQAGHSDAIQSTVEYLDAAGNPLSRTSGSTGIVIQEPNLTITKAERNLTKGDADFSAVTPPDGGDRLEYKVTITNGTVNAASAYDINVTDALNPGLRYVNGTLRQTYDGNTTAMTPDVTGTGEAGAPQTIKWGRTQAVPQAMEVAPGKTVTYTYQVEVLNSVTAGQVLGSSTSLDWTSLSGDQPNERNGSGGTNDYFAGANTSVQVPDVNTLAMAKVSDTFDPADPNLRVGDVVTFSLTLHLQEGTVSHLGVTSTLPAGMEFVDTVSVNGDTTAPYTAVEGWSYSDIPGLNTPSAGERNLSWTLGTVTHVSDANPANDTLVIVYRAVVTGVDPAELNLALDTKANLTYDGKSTAAPATEVNQSIQVKQPRLTIAQTADPAGGSNIMADQLVTYTVTVSNTGTAPAYDPQLQSGIPVGMRERGTGGIQVKSIEINHAAKPLPSPADNPNFVSDGLVLWNLDHGTTPGTYTILPGESLVLVYAVRADSDLTPETVIGNTAGIRSYASVDDDDLPAGGDLTKTALYGPHAPASVSHNTISTPGMPVFSGPAHGKIGEEVAYQIKLPGDGSAVDIIMYDLEARISVPEQLELRAYAFGPGNEALGTLATEYDGDTLILKGIDSLPANKQAVLNLVFRVKNIAASQAGVQCNIGASYTYELTDGGTDDFSGGSGQSGLMTIQEPQVTVLYDVRNVTKGDADFDHWTAPDTGDILEFQVTAENILTATAYDLNFSGFHSEGLSYVDGTLIQTIDGTSSLISPDLSGTGGAGSPQNLCWGHNQLISRKIDLDPGKIMAYIFRCKVLDTVAVHQYLISVVHADWTSMDGDSAGERTSSTGVNDYHASDTVTVQSSDANTLALEGTSDTFNPLTPDVRVGDVVTYTLTVGLQEGTTPELVVTSALPEGMEFVDTVAVLADTTAPYTGSGNFQFGPIPAEDTPAAGTRGLSWNLGTVVNLSDGDTTNDLLTIVYRAKVTGLHPTPIAQVLTTEANFRYTGKTASDDATKVSTTVQAKQPLLSVTQTAEPANGGNIMADQRIRYIVSVTNNGVAPAYDVRILGKVPAGMRASGIDGITVESIHIHGVVRPVKGPEANPAFADDGILRWNLDDNGTADTYTVLPGETLELAYSVRADHTLAPNQTITNYVQIDKYTSLDDDALPSGAAPADAAVYGPSAQAQVIHNTIAIPGSPTVIVPAGGVAVGETVTCQIKLPGDGSVVDTKMYDMVLKITLPDNLQFTGIDSGTGNQVDGRIQANQTGNTVTVTGLDELSARKQVILDLTCTVRNISENQAGTGFDITASYTYELANGHSDEFPGGAQTGSLTIAEPTVAVKEEVKNTTKGDSQYTVAPTQPDAGDILEYRVTITAGSGSNTSTAYDAQLTGNLSEGLQYMTGTLHQLEGGNPAITPDVVGTGNAGAPQTLRWGRESGIPFPVHLAPGQVLTYTYQVKVLDAVTNGQNLTHAIHADWTSLAGIVPGERDGSGVVNDYTANDSMTVTTPDTNSLILMRASDTFNGAEADARIGDLVTYVITLHLQEGKTSGLQVTAQLPAGLEFVRTVQIQNDDAAPYASSGFLSYTDIPAGNTPLAGDHALTWALGDVLNTGDNLANDTLTIVFQARVTKDLSPEPVTQTPTVQADLTYAGKTRPADETQDNIAIEVKQPLVNIRIDASPAANSNIMAGQEIYYTLTATNTGTAPAYDLQIRNTIPAGMRQAGLNGVVVDTIKIDGHERPVKAADPNAQFADNGLALWNLDHGATADTYTLLPGQTLELVYHLRADGDLTPGEAIQNKALIQTYYSLDDDQLPPGAALADRAGYAPSALTTVSHNTIATPGLLTLTGPATAAIGEEITYQLRIPGDTIVDADLYDLAVAVRLPAHVEFVTAAFAQSNQAAGTLQTSLAGDTLTLTGIDRMAARERAVIDLTVRVKNLDTTVAGTQFTVSGSYTYELKDGGTDHFDGGTAVAASVTVTEPLLALTKTGPAFARVGTPVPFTLEVTNTGTGPAWQTTVADTLPAEMRDAAPVITQITVGNPPRTLSADNSRDYDVNYDPATGKWTVSIHSAAGTIAPGEVLTINYLAQLNPRDYENISITNQAVVEQYYSLDTQNGLPEAVRNYDVPGEQQTSGANITIQAPLVTAAIRADRAVAHPDEPVHYRVELTNNGNIDAEQVELTVQMAEEFAPGTLGGIAVSSGNVTAEEPEGGVHGSGSFTVGGITIPRAGGIVTVEWDVRLKPVIANGTIVQNQTELLVPALIQAVPFDAVNVTIDSTPVLLVEKDDLTNGALLQPGDQLTYSIRIANVGNDNAVNTVVTDQIPSNTVYVPGSMTCNGQTVADDNGFPMTNGFAVGRIPVGQETMLQFKVQVPVEVALGTVVSNQAVVTAEGEGNTHGVKVIEVFSDDPGTGAANEPTRTVIGGFPILDAQKVVTDDNGGELENGDILTYTIDITNLGSAEATQVQLQDAIPEETTYIEGTLRIIDAKNQRSGFQTSATRSEGWVKGRDIFVDLGTIVPAQTAEIILQVRLDDAQDGQILISQGIVSSRELPDELTDADGNDSNGDQPTEIVVGSAPVLRATMQAFDLNGDLIQAGEMIEYNISVRNIGTLEATGTGMKIQLPAELIYVPDTTTLNGARVADPTGSRTALEEGLTIGYLGIQDSATIRFRVTVADDVAPGTSIDLQAVYTADRQLTGVTDSDLDDGLDNANAAFVLAHPELYQGIDVNNRDNYFNDDDPTRIQAGSNPGTANVSGTVWFDANHDDLRNPGEALCANWTVEIYQKDTLIDTTTTNADGFYKFRGLTPGNGYKLYFLQPAQQMVSGAVTEIEVLSGVTDNTQNYPFEPTGIVYNAVTREPVGGAVLTITGPQGFDPVQHLLPGQQNQLTRTDGMYKFDLTADAPEGEYHITVTPPLTYSPGFPSTMIVPENGAVQIDPARVIAGSYPVVDHNQPPLSGEETGYYLTIHHLTGDAVIINNHIPLDPVMADSILLTKRTNKSTVAVGEFVQYTVTVENKIAAVITPFSVIDYIPAGFKYVAGSARINGQAVEPEGTKTLRWKDLQIAPNGTATITYYLVVGTGVSEGKIYQNRVIAVHQLTETIISNEASAGVQVIADPLFTNALVVGKVFHDINGDGLQQNDEPGIPDVRIITLSGQIITTDAYGRFHLVDSRDGTFTKGNSLVLKVDPTSLPANAELLTVNPVYIRLTGVMQRVNFAVRIPEPAVQ